MNDDLYEFRKWLIAEAIHRCEERDGFPPSPKRVSGLLPFDVRHYIDRLAIDGIIVWDDSYRSFLRLTPQAKVIAKDQILCPESPF